MRDFSPGKAAGSLQSEEQVTVPVSQSTIQGTTTQTVPSESVSGYIYREGT